MTGDWYVPKSITVGEDRGGGMFTATASSLYSKPEMDGSPTISKRIWPKFGEEIHFVRLLEDFHYLPHVDNKPFQCANFGYVTFEAAKYCFGCTARNALFVTALLTFFLEGSEAAKKVYQDSGSRS